MMARFDDALRLLPTHAHPFSINHSTLPSTAFTMVGTRSKARRASTPLSSPPPSPAPSMPSYAFNPRSSSYYTDDQSDSCFGGDYGFNDTDSDSECGSDDLSESDSNHEEHCSHHSTSLATHCNGRTYSGKRCSRRAYIFDEGFLPVCRSHQWYGSSGKAGRCQAIAECGHLCNRLAPHAPPYHFCDKHQKGSESLPCFIIRLPTELRLMIFRCLLPDVITAERSHANRAHTAVLFVSRQFYEEATMLIYSELKFEAIIWPTYIQLFGKRWDRVSTVYDCKEPSKSLCPAGARRIRHLDVQVNFFWTQSRVKGVGGAGVTHEEYELYQMRDTVRKLVDILSPSPYNSDQVALKRLSVTPAPSCRQRWRSDEASAAIFFVIEPFLGLAPIQNVVLQPPPRPTLYTWRERNFVSHIADLHKDDDYRQCRKQWISAMKKKSSRPESTLQVSDTTAALEAAFKKIEDFAQLIYKQDSCYFSGMCGFHACLTISLLYTDLSYAQLQSTLGHPRSFRESNAYCTSLGWRMNTTISSVFTRFMKLY